MVHRLHNRNTGYNNMAGTLASNQSTLSATDGATALNLNNIIEENNIVQQTPDQKENEEQATQQSSLENISIENATYLQNIEETSVNKDVDSDENMETFEVDSIELATPELFSDNEEKDLINQDVNENEPKIFESSKSEEEITTKEPEMFEESNLEEDFEIPAFLRRQKN